MEKHVFFIPQAEKKSHKVYPVFIPFKGCPERCIFCSQETQTGKSVASIPNVLKIVSHDLQQMQEVGAKAIELAFYGGTFTALSQQDLALCLDFVKYWQDSGMVKAVRCSTRPDTVFGNKLQLLQQAGFSTIELGIQSFCTDALAKSKRGYTGATAQDGCKAVKSAGFSLGVQLLPGMPGVTPQIAKEDLLTSIALNCDFLRLYPCMVFAGTPLEQLWKAGLYQPWDFDTTLNYLAWSLRNAWAKNIPVIRVGLAPEQEMLAGLLAGVFHPALGNMAKGLALAALIEEEICKLTKKTVQLETLLEQFGQKTLTKAMLDKYFKPFTPALAFALKIPKKWQGDFWGYKKSLQGFYARLGILQENTQFHSSDDFVLEYNTSINEVNYNKKGHI